MRIGITGGGNVYALNFARFLSKCGIDHFGIGRTGPKPRAFWQVDHDYRFYEFHMIRDFDAVMACIGVERPDVIVNFAAQGEGAASFGTDSHLFYATNATAMVRFAEALRGREHLQRFIQIGTSELYGSLHGPAMETSRLRPSSPYAISKAAFDQHLEVMWRIHQFPMNIIRPSNCYCPGQQLHRVIPQALIAALSNRKMTVQGGGLARKSYLHADDLSDAILKVIMAGTVGEVYNCGPDEPIAIRDLIAHVAVVCRVPYEYMAQIGAPRKGEDACYWLDSSKLKYHTGWRPSTELNAGLQEMLEWVKRHPEIMSADPTYRIAE